MELGSNLTAVIIALIGGGFSVFAAWVAKNNRKDTKGITTILANSKTPVESLDQIILVLQRELRESDERHRKEKEYLQSEIDELRVELAACRAAREQFYKDMEDFKKRREDINQ